MIEIATTQDKKELSSLWQMTFLEDTQVIEDFFQNVFPTTATPIIKIGDEIASALFLLPCKIGDYKGKCVYCAMTKYAHRGKGYMKQLLDFSYDYCKDNNLDFLFLVPAESSLFDYYAKCGFQKFGISRCYILTNEPPIEKDKLKYKWEIEFSDSVLKYWENTCVVYGGKATDFGLVFDDEETVIRNSRGNYCDIPLEYRKKGIKVIGNTTFGESYTPAMIKTENKILSNTSCYIGITLE